MQTTRHKQIITPLKQKAEKTKPQSPKNEPVKHYQSDGDEEGQLALDVYQTPTEIVIMAPIAGVKLSDINVSITEDILTIKGKRYLEFDIPEQDYLTQECFWGDFSRSIVLPAAVDTAKISAGFKDAVLKISIPRTERSKMKLIRIKEE